MTDPVPDWTPAELKDLSAGRTSIASGITALGLGLVGVVNVAATALRAVSEQNNDDASDQSRQSFWLTMGVAIGSLAAIYKAYEDIRHGLTLRRLAYETRAERKRLALPVADLGDMEAGLRRVDEDVDAVEVFGSDVLGEKDKAAAL